MFIRIYTGLLASILVAILICYLILTLANQSRLNHHTQQIFEGTFQLITEGVSRHSGSKRAQWLNVVSQLIGVPLTLISPAELNNLSASIDVLENDGMQVVIADGLTHIYMPLSFESDAGQRSTQVLKAEFENISEQQIRIAAFLILNELGRNTGQQQGQMLTRLQGVFAFPIATQKISLTPLDRQQQKRIARGDVVVVFDQSASGEESLFAYAPLNREDDVLVLGPIPVFDPTPMPIILSLIALSILITAGVSYVMVRHVELRLQQVDNAIGTFGLGHMKTRVTLEGSDAVARLGFTVNSMADRISELIESHKRLTQAVSHEIRTPVSRLKFRLEMLRAAQTDEDREARIEGMQRDIGELNQLVDEILTHSKLDQAALPLNLDNHNVVELAKACIEEQQVSFPDCNIQLYTAQAQRVMTECDAVLMKRLLNNLMSNACKHCHSTVSILISNHAQDLIIEVEDDGKGIAQQDRDIVFAPFQRLDTSRNRETGGYGLGLAIAKHIAKAHQGELSVQNAQLGGAAFVFKLPLISPAVASTEATQA